MATPLGHSIVAYTLARLAGVKTTPAMAAAIGIANLPDVDFLAGYVANGDLRSLHHEVITHKPAFALLAGAAAGLAAAGLSLLRGRPPAPRDVLSTAALAAGLVSSHLVMDLLPLPYEGIESDTAGAREVVAVQSWNAVVDIAVYGGLAVLLVGTNGHDAAKA